MRRINPNPKLAAGSYLVNHSFFYSDRGLAPLVVALYDENFNNPPQTSPAITFASFTSVEGDVGAYGLTLAYSNSSGSQGNKAHAPSLTGASNGAMSMNVTYTNDGGDPQSVFQWAQSQNVQFAMPAGYAHVNAVWPSALNISLNNSTVKPPICGSIGSVNYWKSLALEQQFLDGTATLGSDGPINSKTPCGNSPFAKCTIPSSGSSSSLSFNSGNQQVISQHTYTFKATISDTVNGSYSVGACGYNVVPTSGSKAVWTLTAPALTINR